MNILIGDEVYTQNPHKKYQLEWGVVTKVRENKSDWAPSYVVFDNPYFTLGGRADSYITVKFTGNLTTELEREQIVENRSDKRRAMHEG